MDPACKSKGTAGDFTRIRCAAAQREALFELKNATQSSRICDLQVDYQVEAGGGRAFFTAVLFTQFSTDRHPAKNFRKTNLSCVGIGAENFNNSLALPPESRATAPAGPFSPETRDNNRAEHLRLKFCCPIQFKLCFHAVRACPRARSCRGACERGMRFSPPFGGRPPKIDMFPAP